MKKLISIFIIFASTLIVCMNTTMSTFAAGNIEIQNHINISNKIQVSLDDCCKESQNNDFDNDSYECCKSPYTNSTITSNITSAENVKKDFNESKIKKINLIVLLKNKLEENYINKLNSPPINKHLKKPIKSYTTLTGIIKSNN